MVGSTVRGASVAPTPPRRIDWRTALRLRRRLRREKKLSTRDSFVFDVLRPGDVAIDCGANVGDVTAHMSDRGAEVHAFEPDPVAFEKLCQRFAGAGRVHCHNLAVSNRSGRMKLYYREERATDPVLYSVGSTLESAKKDVDAETFSLVDVAPLASFISAIPRVRLLKVDIEGAEADVLEDLLAKGLFDRIDLTVVETHEQWLPEIAPRVDALRKVLSRRHVYFNWT